MASKGPVLCAGLALMTAACAGVPKLEFRDPGHGPDPATRLVSHALCEIASAKAFKALQDGNYTTVLTLTVKGEDNAGAAPGLAFRTPFTTSAPAFFEALVIGGEFSKKRERTLTQEVTVKLKELDGAAACAADTQSQLLGDYGIADILDRAPAGSPYGVLGKDVAKFGTTVIFTVKWAVAGGPNVVRVHFVGPSDKGFLSASRIDTSSLVIGFAKPPPAPTPPRPIPVVIVDIETLMEELAPPDQKSFLSQRPRTTAEAQEQARQRAILRQRAEREAERLRREAQAEADRQNAERASDADARAAEAARSLVTQMILQNLTLAPR